MARTETIQISLGYKAPDFDLPNVVTGENNTLQELKGEKATVVMFLCNHCPFVVHVLDELIRLGNEYKEKNIGFVAISSNDVVNYPADAPGLMKKLALSKDFPFPYLYDESQEIAKAYTAACTPDLSIFDQDLNCVYRGQLDDSRPGNQAPNNGKDLRAALDAILVNQAIPEPQHPSIGCNIKWKQ